MLQEIQEQPEVLEKTIKAESAKLKKLGAFLRGKDIDLIILVARGSSDNASLLGRYLLEITTGIPVSLSAPSVFTLYKAKLKLSRALVIGRKRSTKWLKAKWVSELPEQKLLPKKSTKKD